MGAAILPATLATLTIEPLAFRCCREHRTEVRVGRGVVHEDVDFAVGLQRLVEHVLSLVGTARVAGDWNRLAALGPDLVRHGLQAFDLSRDENDFGSLFGHVGRDGRADPAACPCDDRDLVP
jgi:hypothetical protein